jgi:acetyl-CoA carboxylase biotin carboxyl carrier protein
LTFEQIKELIELVSERGLQGLELERSGFRLKVDGEPSAYAPAALAPSAPPAQMASFAPSAPAPAASAAPSPAPQAAPAAAPAAATPAPEADDDVPAGATVIPSPIVGTFYSSSSPDAAPFVSVGDRVKAGQTLCIVEAMKIMNEIESDVDGTVVKVFVGNGQAVEFEEPLFAIQEG